MKHLLLFLFCSSFAVAQNCNYLMIDDYCTKTANDDFERYEFTKHEHYSSVINKLKHLKISKDSNTIIYLAKCKDMQRMYALHFRDKKLTLMEIMQATNKKYEEGLFNVAIDNVKMYFVEQIKYEKDGVAYFDNECYTVTVQKTKNAIKTTILMK